MKLGTISVFIGLVLCVLGGRWYRGIMKVAVGFAGTAGTAMANLDRAARMAGGIVCLGLVVVIIGMVALLFTKDEDD